MQAIRAVRSVLAGLAVRRARCVERVGAGESCGGHRRARLHQPVQLPRHSSERPRACRSGRSSTSGFLWQRRRRAEDRDAQPRHVERLPHQIDGVTNRDGELTSNKWYESDLYATLGLGFGPTALSFNYTSYTSPGEPTSRTSRSSASSSPSTTAARSARGAQAVCPGRVRAERRRAGGRRRRQGHLRRARRGAGLRGIEGVDRVSDQGRAEREGLLRVRHRRGLEVRLLQHRRDRHGADRRATSTCTAAASCRRSATT